ncbi:putative receptor protein kinase ZmPK1 [Hordeum vulgare]|nr:putative receptor protein kinase ZmPK1 [Hordeum vulgare]
MVFNEMATSFNEDAYFSTMGVGSSNFHWSQTNELHQEDHENEVDEEGEGMIDAPSGRASNYTVDEDIFLCNTWFNVFMDAIFHNIAQSLFRGEEKKTKKGKVKRGRAFMLPCFYEVLKDQEKWKKRPNEEETKKDNVDVVALDDDDEEEASSYGTKRSPTPNFVAYSKPKIPSGQEK